MQSVEGETKSDSKQLSERVGLLFFALEIPPLEPPVDQHYAEVRHHLVTQGTPIGPNDLLVVAHALAADLTPVTADTCEFERVPSLRIESWMPTSTKAPPEDHAGPKANPWR